MRVGDDHEDESGGESDSEGEVWVGRVKDTTGEGGGNGDEGGDGEYMTLIMVMREVMASI